MGMKFDIFARASKFDSLRLRSHFLRSNFGFWVLYLKRHWSMVYRIL